ncbi:hypothetical protein SO694_0052900, partial [Aureococcus anophagefferens]
MAGDRGDAGPSVRGSRIVGYGGGGDYDDPAVGDPGAAGLSDAPGGSAQRGRGPGRGPPPVGGYDDAAGRDMPYGGGTPIDADSVGGAPRTAVRGSRIVGFGGGGEYDDPAAGDPMAGDRGGASPSVRGSRIVGYGGGGDYDDLAAGDPGAAGLSDAPGGSTQRGRGPGRGPPPVGGYDDAAGRDMPYGGGTPIDADSVGGAPRAAVRGSRIVGFGGGGEYDDANDAAAGPSRTNLRDSRMVGPDRGTETPGESSVYDGGDPSDAAAGGPGFRGHTSPVRASRIVGMGGGGEGGPFDTPGARDAAGRDLGGVAPADVPSSVRDASAPAVRGSRIVGFGGGEDPTASGDLGADDAPGGGRDGRARGAPPAGGYDDAAGPGRAYGGGTPIDAPGVSVRGSRIVGFGGGDEPAAGSGARSDWDESVSFVAPLEERAPPPPWVQAVDPATGATYYSNPDTGESSWTRPLDG